MERKMKIVVVSAQNAEKTGGFERFVEMLKRNENMEVTRIYHEAGKRRDIVGEVKALRPEMMITADLPGFGQCTLTDNISYNLLDCKQLHFLFREKLSDEQYLKKQLSIAMFFYCVGSHYCEYLNRQYPDIPYLKVLEDWQQGSDEGIVNKNAEILFRAFQEVLRECMIWPEAKRSSEDA